MVKLLYNLSLKIKINQKTLLIKILLLFIKKIDENINVLKIPNNTAIIDIIKLAKTLNLE